jgi:hypothetical protein
MALTSGTADAPAGNRPRRSRRRFWLVVVVLLVLAVPAFGLGVVYLAPTAFLGPPKEADSTGEIKKGMRPAEVAKVLSIDSPPGGFIGTITWARDGRVLRVRFVQGRVNGVEEGSLPLPVTMTKVTEDVRGARQGGRP